MRDKGRLAGGLDRQPSKSDPGIVLAQRRPAKGRNTDRFPAIWMPVPDPLCKAEKKRSTHGAFSMVLIIMYVSACAWYVRAFPHKDARRPDEANLHQFS